MFRYQEKDAAKLYVIFQIMKSFSYYLHKNFSLLENFPYLCN